MFKTNDYIRAIDAKLGNPLNTYSQLNDITWDIYKKEQLAKVNFSKRFKQKFHYMKVKFYFNFLKFYYFVLERLHLIKKEQLADFDVI